jgi:bacillithiol biosynthesis cysteine-adding enzyme BshC
MMHHQHFINAEQSGLYGAMILDYLKKKPGLREFYSHAPDIRSFADAINQKNKQPMDRALLAQVIADQYKALGLTSSHVKSQITRLHNENTFTVCTGHQACLFTGPLYFIYKICSTIALANALNKDYTEQHAVPVFWIASEDHDFAEIDHAQVFGKTIRWEKPFSEEQTPPVGRLSTATMHGALEELRSMLGADGRDVFAIMEQAYDGKKTLAQATAYLVYTLFAETGLLVLDADDARLKNRFASTMQRELLEHVAEREVLKTNTSLLKHGYKVQVNPRLINLFYQTTDHRGRIEQKGDGFFVHGTPLSFQKQELVDELKTNPDRFSPNVLMRPLYQESILPNLAYIGGPGELAYWLQLKSLFEANALAMPVLMLRQSLLYVDGNAVKKMKKLGLSSLDFFQDADALVKQYVKAQSDFPDITDEHKALDLLFTRLAERFTAVDSTLKATVEGEHKKVTSAVNNLQEKLVKAQKKKLELAVNQIRSLREKLFPEGVMQERSENFIPFYVKQGPGFISNVLKSMHPFDQRVIVLEEQGQ